MDSIRDRHRAPLSGAPAHPTDVAALLLTSSNPRRELPPLAELTAATTTLARGVKRKVLLPLGGSPTEFALVRRGDEVLVSAYETGSVPEVHQLDHPAGLLELLDACARATFEGARLETDPTARQIAVRMAERATHTTVGAVAPIEQVVRCGGASSAPDTPVAFGFEARMLPSPSASGRVARADVHALLFDGRLWAWLRGRRVSLGQGPIMLRVQRMVVAARALVDAWEAGRSANVRLRSGDFRIGLRLGADDEVSMTLGTRGGEVRAVALDVPQTVLPILRVASDLLRTLVAVDRNQSRNLRVSSLRDELRCIRQAVREQGQRGFINRDPDRLRLGMPSEVAEEVPAELRWPAPPPTGIRFDERWRIGLDGLDAGATFFCGDRLVLATPTHSLAVDRSSGDVLWAREGAASTFMAASTLVRLSAEGDVELCEVESGEAYARARIAPRVGGPTMARAVGGGALPPMVVLAEGAGRLVAIDLRTGEPRWRFSSRRASGFQLRRAGRLLLVACDGAIHAVDVASGEDVWRFAGRARFHRAPAVVRDVAVAASGGARPRAFGIDLLTGERRWSLALPGRLAGDALATGPLALLPLERDRVMAVDAQSGRCRWEATDPGLGVGGAALCIDDAVVANAPGGGLSALELRDGTTRWMRMLGEPLTDEVPRRLEPVLRSGALFVPAATVHIVRPSDGASLGQLPCDLVPDRLRVDERGWVYVAEESGHLAAYAPAPHLRVIRGGG